MSEGQEKKTRKTTKKTKVVITGGVAWLGLPYNLDQEVLIDAEKAKELIDLKVAKKA